MSSSVVKLHWNWCITGRIISLKQTTISSTEQQRRMLRSLAVCNISVWKPKTNLETVFKGASVCHLSNTLYLSLLLYSSRLLHFLNLRRTDYKKQVVAFRLLFGISKDDQSSCPCHRFPPPPFPIPRCYYWLISIWKLFGFQRVQNVCICYITIDYNTICILSSEKTNILCRTSRWREKKQNNETLTIIIVSHILKINLQYQNGCAKVGEN